MFKEARIKLTAWYLVIIMAISLAFSCAIYMVVDRELVALDALQRDRQVRVDNLRNFLVQNGLPLPLESPSIESETLEQARVNIIYMLVFIDIAILIISGLGGYFLAGRTLEPISKMVKDQKGFIGNASHELRTPLTSMMTEIEVSLRDKNLSLTDAKILLKSNLDEVKAMQKLSNYLLKLNRYDNSEVGLTTEKMNLGTVVLNAVESTRPYANESGIKIITKIVPVHMKSNEEAITELATILIDNAIKYSGNAKRIEVSTKKDGALTIRDFGVGIAEADIPHIFDKFFRADTSRNKSKVDGYGLGLSIAKSIADKLGADIEVESRVGRGSTFTVHLAR